MKKSLRLAALALSLGAVGVVATPVFAGEKTDNPVVATVNGAKILRAQVMHELQAMGPQAAQMPAQVLYPRILEKVILTKLVSSKGYENNIHKDQEVVDRLKEAEEQIVADVYVRKTIQPKITETMVKKRYDELSSKYKPVDEVRARHILVKTEEEAKTLLKKLKDGADFAKLATENSKDEGSAKQGGDLGYFASSVMVKPFADAAFALKVGAMTEKPVKTDFGYHIIKLEDRRKSSPPPMEEVKDQIMGQIGQEMVSALIKELESKAKIEKFNIDGTPLKEEKKDAPKPEAEKKAE